MSETAILEFNQTRVVKAPDQDDVVFEAGQRYELSVASCERWVRRGVATFVDSLKKPKPRKRKPADTNAGEGEGVEGEGTGEGEGAAEGEGTGDEVVGD